MSFPKSEGALKRPPGWIVLTGMRKGALEQAGKGRVEEVAKFGSNTFMWGKSGPTIPVPCFETAFAASRAMLLATIVQRPLPSSQAMVYVHLSG